MIRARSLTAVGAVASVGLLLAGCGGGSSGEGGGGGDGQTEVRMLVNVTPNLTEEWWNDLVAPFEDANPEIDVIIQNPGAEGAEAALPRLLAAGDPPDVVQSLAPTPEMAEELLDFSEYEWATTGPLAEQYSIDGQYYMAGIGLQLQSLIFYNKTAFAEAGITEVPGTLDELDAAAAALSEAGWTPVQTGGDWMSSHALQALGLPTVIAEHPDWYTQVSAGELTFSETYGFAVDLYADWVAEGYIPQEALGIQYPDAEQAFLAGEAALYPMGSWFAGTLAQAEDPADIGVFAAPAAAGIDNPAMGANIASPYSVLEASPAQEAAVQLVEFLTTDQDAVIDQLQVDGNFREGYEYETTELGDALAQIVADTPASDYTPTGTGYGERRLPDGYSEEINSQTQALMTGVPSADVQSQLDDWFAASIG